MRDYMDDLLKQAMESDARPSDKLEQDTFAKMVPGSEGQGAKFFKRIRGAEMHLQPVLAVMLVFVAVLALTSGYVAAHGIDVGQMLYTHLWGAPKDNEDVKAVQSELEVVSENSTFEDISISPVEAFTDGMLSYVVVKVEGQNGFELTDDMGFGRSDLLDQDGEAGNVQSCFLLEREDNAMYIALERVVNQTTGQSSEEINIVIDNLYYVSYREDGMVATVKYLRETEDAIYYTEESIAAKGTYEAKINCSVLDESASIEGSDNGEDLRVTLHPLGVTVKSASGIVERVSRLDIPEEEQGIYLVMEDGEEIQATFISNEGTIDGMQNELFVVGQPVDPAEVKGIRIRQTVLER